MIDSHAHKFHVTEVLNTEVLRNMSRDELEAKMTELDLWFGEGDTDDALRDFIFVEIGAIGARESRCEEDDDERYHGGDSPGSYGPDDPGPGGR